MIELAPHKNSYLLGHDAALASVVSAFKEGHMPQAWLICGKEGVGKATLSYHIANYVMSEGKNQMGRLDMENPVARLIAAEAHPDLFVLSRPVDDKTGELKDSIAAEDARTLAPFLHRTATQGRWRVAIIDEAQALNRFGQNAILKVIEEPPKDCLILVNVTTSGLLLPTIRSRCRMIQLNGLQDGTMRALFNRLEVEGSDEDQSRLIRLAEGSIGFALKIMRAEALPLYDEMLEILKSMPELEVARLHSLADKVAKKANSEAFSVLSTLLVAYLRTSARQVAVDQGARGTLDCALQLWEKVGQIFAMAAQSNLDRKLAFINAMTEINRTSL